MVVSLNLIAYLVSILRTFRPLVHLLQVILPLPVDRSHSIVMSAISSIQAHYGFAARYLSCLVLYLDYSVMLLDTLVLTVHSVLATIHGTDRVTIHTVLAALLSG